MLDVSRFADVVRPNRSDAQPLGQHPLPFPYFGPDRRARRAADAQQLHWVAAAFDEIDYGMLLVTEPAQTTYINHAARCELDALHPLQLVGRELRARHAADAAHLDDALQAAAQRGLRRLLTLGVGAQRVNVSIVPLPAPPALAGAGSVTLLMLGKRRVCEALSVQGFARGHGLTTAESRVLGYLCQGVKPTEIASRLGVAISTVRTQIGNIRLKTGAESIRALVQQVALLPPLMSVLRSAGLPAEAAAAAATPVLDDAALTLA